MKAPSQPPQRVDVYDEHNLQAKALEKWNKQREAWDGIKTKLLTQTGKGNPSKGFADNFIFSGIRNRERQEELGMIEAAVPLSALNSHYTWECMLRRENDSDGGRYVQVGKAYFPYALFAEVKDPTSRSQDHAVYTRVVAEDYIMDPLATIDERTGRRESWAARKSRTLSTNLQGRFAETAQGTHNTDIDELTAALQAMGDAGSGYGEEYDGNGMAAAAGADQRGIQSLDAPTHLAATNDYYRHQLRSYAPYIQKHFSHFFAPRQFLSVDGIAAPIHLFDADAADGMFSGPPPSGDVEPVQYYPPPSPPQQQRVALPCLASRHGSASTATPKPVSDAVSNNHSISVRLSSVGEVLAAPGAAPSKSVDTNEHADGMNDSRVLQGSSRGSSKEDDDIGATALEHELGSVADTPSLHPSLELSTQRLFLSAKPGELAHAHLTIRNIGSTTVYYSWVSVDLVQEDIIDSAEDGAVSEGAEGGNAAEMSAAASEQQQQQQQQVGDTTPKDRLFSGSAFLKVQQTIHSMAQYATSSTRYFRLSSPTNGVILPDEDELFPFSVRAPSAGRFKQRFELLTIPPSPLRIFVEVTALVKHQGISATAMARPVEAALNARGVADSQRHLIQRLLRSDLPWDCADLLAEMSAVRQAKQSVVDAEEARRRAQREAWLLANAATYDNLPYNRAVFDKLEKLWENLHITLDALVRSDTEEDGKSAVAQAQAAAPSGGLSSRTWNGSINLLLASISRLRDSPARCTLYDAAMALLRVARSPPTASESSDVSIRGDGEASEQAEKEPLSSLLHRAADALAAHVAARRLAAYQQEVEMLQLPLEPSLYALAGVANGAAASAAAGDRKKRAPSAGAAVKKGGGVSSATAAASGSVAGGFGAPNEPIVLGSLRGHLRDGVALRGEEEEEGRRLEREEMVAAFKRGLDSSHKEVARTFWQELSDAIEAGCDLPMTTVVQARRLSELRLIQTHEAMTVDSGAEALPLKTNVSGNSGRKRTS